MNCVMEDYDSEEYFRNYSNTIECNFLCYHNGAELLPHFISDRLINVSSTGWRVTRPTFTGSFEFLIVLWFPRFLLISVVTGWTLNCRRNFRFKCIFLIGRKASNAVVWDSRFYSCRAIINFLRCFFLGKRSLLELLLRILVMFSRNILRN